MFSPAPIILFVYNRPLHTCKLLRSLLNNPFHEQSELFIYCDGPKTNADEEMLQSIAEVRRIIRKEKWTLKVSIVEHKTNKGLADSIIEGVTDILKRYDKVIVLEDDLILSPFFLTYMNNALNMYSEEEKVMHISGYMYPVKGKLPPSFFLGITTCWGWATWKRAWDFYIPSAEALLDGLEQSGRMSEFTFNGAAPFYNHLVANTTGHIKTWAIKWQTSVFLKNGLTLHPFPTLVLNTGNDGSGEHSDQTLIYDLQNLADKVELSKNIIYQSNNARILIEKFYRTLNGKKSILQRIVGKLTRIANRL